MKNLKVTTFRIDPDDEERLDKLSDELHYWNRGDLIRAAVKLFLNYCDYSTQYKCVWDLNKFKPDNNWHVTYDPIIGSPEGDKKQ